MYVYVHTEHLDIYILLSIKERIAICLLEY